MTQNNPSNQNPNTNNQNTSGSSLDIDQLGRDKNYDVDISIKSPKSNWDHFREIIPELVGALIAIIVVICSVIILTSDTAKADDKKNAQSMLTLVIGLTVGYGAGQAKAKKN